MTDVAPRKACGRCRESKPLEDFHRCASARDGRQGRCRACAKETSATFRAEHPEHMRAQLREKFERLQRRVFRAYGGKCTCCGESHPKFLTIEHLGRARAGYAIYRWVIDHRFPTNITLRCYNCNFGRAANGGVCPHEEERAGASAA